MKQYKFYWVNLIDNITIVSTPGLSARHIKNKVLICATSPQKAINEARRMYRFEDFLLSKWHKPAK